MRLKSVTVKAWAEANSYRPDTVYKTLYGNRGKADRGESFKSKEGFVATVTGRRKRKARRL
jgi:gp16 family phage-associated protein